MNVKELQKEFWKNQKKIDARKTTKEERRELIQENKKILKKLQKTID